MTSKETSDTTECAEAARVSAGDGGPIRPQAQRLDERDQSEQAQCGPEASSAAPREYGGRKQGLDPTRYGDWEKNGRCIDF